MLAAALPPDDTLPDTVRVPDAGGGAPSGRCGADVRVRMQAAEPGRPDRASADPNPDNAARPVRGPVPGAGAANVPGPAPTACPVRILDDAAPATPFVALDDARAGRLLLFRRPGAIVCARTASEVPDALDALDRASRAGRHLAGYFAYELGLALEPRLRALLPGACPTPLLWFGVFDAPPEVLQGADQAAFWHDGAHAYAGPLRLEWDEAEYAALFGEAVRLIRAGDIFQLNLTLRGRFPVLGSTRALFAQLRDQSGAAFGALVDDGARQVLSFSPELFFRAAPDGRIETEPMKGTIGRGVTTGRDRALRARLAGSAKDRAENLMIVDLLRNDLGRIARIGSVRAEALFAVQTLPTLHQMTSRISARLLPDTGFASIVRALFPCGSITGAPKIRAMEIIAALERSPRGAYCGAIGHVAPDGGSCFNVAIRTITVQDGQGTLGVGGAITLGSTANGEWAECLLKARFFDQGRRRLTLIETLRLESGRFVRESLHLARMERSAGRFAIPFDRAAAAALRSSVAAEPGPFRVRLTLAEDGAFTVSAVLLDPAPVSWRIAVSPIRLRSADPFLRHKTDRRDLYERESARAQADGLDEILFQNERGELCEGARTSLFLEIDGVLHTPALACGLLPGCLRQELLENGRAVERRLFVPDLHRASRILVGNSLRGLVEAVLA